MKNLKKYLTFTTIIAIFSFIVLMLFFTPCITLRSASGFSEPDHILSLFKAMFGCTIALPGQNAISDPIKIAPCAGLILAFVFLIIGILLSIAKNKIKLLGFVATAFYITSGILVACAVPLVIASNYGLSQYGTSYKVGYYGWTIAIATLICFSGLCQFIDCVASFAKPKVQEVY